MRSNEVDANEAYDRAIDRSDLPSHIRDVLLRNRDDDRRHLEYLEKRIAEHKAKETKTKTETEAEAEAEAETGAETGAETEAETGAVMILSSRVPGSLQRAS